MLAPEAVARGLLEAVAAVEDLRLDVPDSPGVVATFVSRAVVDEVLPPSFVDGIPAGAALPHSLCISWLFAAYSAVTGEVPCRPSS